MRNPFWSALAASLIIAAGLMPAHAGVTFYSNETAYDAALAAAGLTPTSFDFNSVSPGNYDNAAGLTVKGVNFVGSTGNGGYWTNLTPPYFCCNDYNNPNTTLQVAAKTSGFYGITNGSTAITLPSGAVAFSFDAYTVQAGDYSGSGHDTLNLTVGGSTGQTMTGAGSTTGFLGVISTTPIGTATLTGTTDEDFIDIVGGTFAGGGALAVSEPGDMTLFGLCAIAGGLALGNRRRRP